MSKSPPIELELERAQALKLSFLSSLLSTAEQAELAERARLLGLSWRFWNFAIERSSELSNICSEAVRGLVSIDSYWLQPFPQSISRLYRG